MMNYLVTLVMVIAALPLSGQVKDYDYFPPSLCKEAGLKQVTVYETKITDPIAHAGPSNKIRLARNVVRQLYFDQEGYRNRELTLERGGDVIRQELLFAHDNNGLKQRENLKFYYTNFADSSRILQNRESRYAYTATRHLSSQVIYLTSDSTRTPTDSVVYIRDITGKLQKEILYSQWPFSSKPSLLLEKEYSYQGNRVVVTTLVNSQPNNRDEYVLDGEGRKVTERNYAPGDTLPRLETHYSYDPRGWLQEIQYIPDWKHFQKGETVVSRKNKFDDHGKLVESQYDYGDSKRLFEFYDHSYWVED